MKISFDDVRIGVRPAGFLLADGRNAWARRSAAFGSIHMEGKVTILPNEKYQFSTTIESTPGFCYADAVALDTAHYTVLRTKLNFEWDENFVYMDRIRVTIQPFLPSPVIAYFELARPPVTADPPRPVAPVLAAIPNRTINQGESLAFGISATDADLPAQVLTFTLEPGAPTGATIDPRTGAFSWAPTASQGPGTYTFAVRVTDSGSTQSSDTRIFTVVVVGSVPEPKIAHLRIAISTAGVPSIEWPATSGATYRLLYKNSLAAPEWSVLGERVATGSTDAFEDKTAASAPRRFYRVEPISGVLSVDPMGPTN